MLAARFYHRIDAVCLLTVLLGAVASQDVANDVQEGKDQVVSSRGLVRYTYHARIDFDSFVTDQTKCLEENSGTFNNGTRTCTATLVFCVAPSVTTIPPAKQRNCALLNVTVAESTGTIPVYSAHGQNVTSRSNSSLRILIPDDGTEDFYPTVIKLSLALFEIGEIVRREDASYLATASALVNTRSPDMMQCFGVQGVNHHVIEDPKCDPKVCFGSLTIPLQFGQHNSSYCDFHPRLTRGAKNDSNNVIYFGTLKLRARLEQTLVSERDPPERYYFQQNSGARPRNHRTIQWTMIAMLCLLLPVLITSIIGLHCWSRRRNRRRGDAKRRWQLANCLLLPWRCCRGSSGFQWRRLRNWQDSDQDMACTGPSTGGRLEFERASSIEPPILPLSNSAVHNLLCTPVNDPRQAGDSDSVYVIQAEAYSHKRGNGRDLHFQRRVNSGTCHSHYQDESVSEDMTDTDMDIIRAVPDRAHCASTTRSTSRLPATCDNAMPTKDLSAAADAVVVSSNHDGNTSPAQECDHRHRQQQHRKRHSMDLD
eukprot:scpid58655/ scgid33897/ 